MVGVNLLMACLLLMFTVTTASCQVKEDKICGNWITKEKNLVVKVFKRAGNLKAKILWFKGEGNKDMDEYKDASNPNPSLRNRKLVGLEIVEGLIYKPETESWENGKIYDPYNGRFWDSAAYITKEGLLKVTGYWKFKWIGKTLTFDKLPDDAIVGNY